MPAKPRVAALDYSSQSTVTSTARKQQLALFGVVIVTLPKSYGSSNHVAFCDYLRDLNPTIKIFNYNVQSEVPDPALSTDHTETYTKVEAENWWVRTTTGVRTRQFAQTNRYDVNFSMHCPVDGSGKRWNRWKAEWDAGRLPSGAYDGSFLDNMMQRLRQDPAGLTGDWDYDNDNETYSTNPSHATNLMIRAGNEEYMDWHKTLRPSHLLMGNIDIGIAPVYGSRLEYAFMEGVMGANYSLETYSTWDAMMAIYEQVSAAHDWVVFNVHLASATDYPMLRYGLATCLLLDNGIFCARAGSSYENLSPWFDEYHAELGAPIEVKTLVTGIWRRKYEGGCVLVNSSKTSSASIDLTGQGYFRITGTQDLVNDGSAAAVVTLAPRSGLILVGTPTTLPIDSGSTYTPTEGPIEYPTFLPRPTALVLEPAERRALGRPGPLTVRARQRDFLAQAQLDFPPMTAENVQALYNWWHDVLDSGGRWFLARDWPTMQGFVPAVYRFLGVPSWSHIAMGVQSAKARVQVRGRGETPQAVDTEVCWTEGFSSGLTPYTTISGIPLMEIVTTEYGSTLQANAHSSAVTQKIRRSVAEHVVSKLRGKFRVMDNNNDDGGVITLMHDTEELVHINTRREGALDAARRILVTINYGTPESLFLGTVGVEIGVWYSFEMNFANGAGYSNIEVVKVADGSVFVSESFAQDHPPVLVNALQFHTDSGIPSVSTMCTTQFARITTCSADVAEPIYQLISRTDTWKYLVVATTDATERQAPEYDDSAWVVGVAPFADRVHPVSDGWPNPGTIITHNMSVWMRKAVTLPYLGSLVSFLLKHDNNAYLWVNGVPMTLTGVASFQSSATWVPDTTEVVVALRVDDVPFNANNFIYADLEATLEI